MLYLQTQQNLSDLPQCYTNLTVINISSFHFGYDKNNPKIPYIHLNDNVPTDPMFDTFWKDMANVRKNGVLVMAMLGGAGGAYTELFANYNVFYPILVATLKAYQFDGIDLDVEEEVSQEDIEQLISDLRTDFPNNFYISSAPVCSALQTGHDPFSGIDWSAFKSEIDWFNVQFYSGFGTLGTVDDYNSIIDKGYRPDQIVGGSLTNPSDGSGYVQISTVAATLKSLNTQYGGIGGAMGWEYYNANDVSEKVDPVGWCSTMKTAVS